MSEHDGNGLVPKLRFDEFEGDGDWSSHKLIELAKFRRGSFPQPYGVPEWYDDIDGMPFIQVYDVYDNLKLKPSTKRRISKLAAKQSVFIKKGTVIVTLQGSIGRVAITQYDAYIDRTLLIFEKFLKPINRLFFAHVIQKLFEIEKQKAPGGIIKTITKEVLSDFITSIPCSKEQQKIADCLTTLDDLITAQSQKIEALKDHKKGLMQNLFPGEGETVPKLRFEAFGGDGDWEKKILEEIATISKGKGISKSDISIGGILPCIRYGELYTYYGEKIENIRSYTNVEANKLVISEGNEVIIPASGETQEDIAKASCVINSGIALGGDLNILRSRLNGIFFSYYLNSAAKEAISRLSQGISVIHLYSSQLKKLYVSIPPQKEQKKIADCLTSLDDLITAQTQKLEHLKDHKKGLMQNLFPSLDEVDE